MPADGAMPRNFLRACLLLLLREQPAHGYELLERLRPLGFESGDPGGLYRSLRALEADGLVRSKWQASETGPDRRTYEISRAGMEQLHRSAKLLVSLRETIADFLSRYEEWVALGTEPVSGGRAGRSDQTSCPPAARSSSSA